MTKGFNSPAASRDAASRVLCRAERARANSKAGAESAQSTKSLDATSAGRHPGLVTTEEDVRRICLALPGVTERLSWGRPAWFVRTLMARMWEQDVLTVKTHERDVLASSAPDTYYWTSHHDRSPLLVLVRLG